MIEHGVVRAVVEPEAVTVDANSVWVAKNVQEVTVQDEQGQRTEFEFSLTQYTKDEYIRALIEQNQTLETDIVNTQIALCEVYELMAAQ